MKWKIILGLILIIISIITLIIYPLQFDFYENSKAKKIIDFIIIPIFFILIIYDIIWNIKKGEKEWKKYFIDFSKVTGLFLIFYFFLLRSFFANGLIFINSAFGSYEKVKISGIIIDKIDIIGSGKFIGEYKLLIKQNEKIFIFDSNHKEIKNLKIGESFEMDMNKGILNLIYK